MTATRYSGRLTIRVTYRDPYDDYRCVVTCKDDAAPSRDRAIVVVCPPASLRHAVDSPIAFDETAHAALSFLSEDLTWVAQAADYTDSGFHIRRKKEWR